ncbi:hypothetical protein ABT282_07425 [Streptomyces sp. NPDC000927]|uniref:hypothetical protein n=1 Tax=Streptomyces sp. NPDC000927 TaxID=3154371 RepID=UPI003323CD60
MQMAGHLSLEFGAVVTGPFRKGQAQEMVYVMRPNGHGVALMMGPGKGLAPESRPGGLDVWNIREADGPDIIERPNVRGMIRFATDLDGARQELREAVPSTWLAHDARQALLKTDGTGQ